MDNIQLNTGQKVYFASDFHLGAPNHTESQKRERKIVRWLNEVSKDAHTIFLVGDLFDFWYEYKRVVPKGFVRLLGKLAELSDSGIQIVIFTGNHDMWMFGYFQEELGISVYRKSQSFQIENKRFHVGHGDGLGPGDHVYKVLKKVFESKICRWFFSRVHPNFAINLAFAWSSRSRASEIEREEQFFGDKEWLIQYSKEVESKQPHDFYLFGHRHYPIEHPVSESAKYVNLGEWINYCTYAEFDGSELHLKTFEDKK